MSFKFDSMLPEMGLRLMVERTSIDDVRMRRAKPPTELIGQNSFIFIKNHHISFFYNPPDISKIIITFAV